MASGECSRAARALAHGLHRSCHCPKTVAHTPTISTMALRELPPLRPISRVAALAAGLACACASPALREPPLEIVIRNVSNSRVASVVQRPCGTDESGWHDLGLGAIDPGASRRVPLPPSCVDLEARGEDGRVRARQQGLTLRPGSGAVWTIR